MDFGLHRSRKSTRTFVIWTRFRLKQSNIHSNFIFINFTIFIPTRACPAITTTTTKKTAVKKNVIKQLSRLFIERTKKFLSQNISDNGKRVPNKINVFLMPNPTLSALININSLYFGYSSVQIFFFFTLHGQIYFYFLSHSHSPIRSSKQ